MSDIYNRVIYEIEEKAEELGLGEKEVDNARSEVKRNLKKDPLYPQMDRGQRECWFEFHLWMKLVGTDFNFPGDDEPLRKLTGKPWKGKGKEPETTMEFSLRPNNPLPVPSSQDAPAEDTESASAADTASEGKATGTPAKADEKLAPETSAQKDNGQSSSSPALAQEKGSYAERAAAANKIPKIPTQREKTMALREKDRKWLEKEKPIAYKRIMEAAEKEKKAGPPPKSYIGPKERVQIRRRKTQLLRDAIEFNTEDVDKSALPAIDEKLGVSIAYEFIPQHSLLVFASPLETDLRGETDPNFEPVIKKLEHAHEVLRPHEKNPVTAPVGSSTKVEDVALVNKPEDSDSNAQQPQNDGGPDGKASE
ncbi:hypothetical protein G7Y89_g7954 [Cudoniella acicularis]|uniref:Uncharacterized protein n=1 Tax=Cudoniella acicularis TaxID=354080 RepID=A0A8H4RHI9_9HELO|nr:hypothetical protein G7Y89_g7954 [Cudoniella acicularis]